MPTTFIFGGSGKVGLSLTRLLTKSNPQHKVYNLTRSAEHNEPINSAGGIPVLHSIEDSSPSELAKVIRECTQSGETTGPVDSIVWAAGAGGKGGPERTDKVDRQGAIDSMDAAVQAGVQRYVLVSAVDVRDRSKSVPGWYTPAMKERGDGSWDKIGRYMEAKLGADKALVEGNGKRELKYTIVRPSGLLDDNGTGKIEAGRTKTFESIPRDDVAAVIKAVLENEETVGLAFDIVGGNTPIEKAVKLVGEKREDTFEGFH